MSRAREIDGLLKWMLDAHQAHFDVLKAPKEQSDSQDQFFRELLAKINRLSLSSDWLSFLGGSEVLTANSFAIFERIYALYCQQRRPHNIALNALRVALWTHANAEKWVDWDNELAHPPVPILPPILIKQPKASRSLALVNLLCVLLLLTAVVAATLAILVVAEVSLPFVYPLIVVEGLAIAASGASLVLVAVGCLLRARSSARVSFAAPQWRVAAPEKPVPRALAAVPSALVLEPAIFPLREAQVQVAPASIPAPASAAISPSARPPALAIRTAPRVAAVGLAASLEPGMALMSPRRAAVAGVGGAHVQSPDSHHSFSSAAVDSPRVGGAKAAGAGETRSKSTPPQDRFKASMLTSRHRGPERPRPIVASSAMAARVAMAPPLSEEGSGASVATPSIATAAPGSTPGIVDRSRSQSVAAVGVGSPWRSPRPFAVTEASRAAAAGAAMAELGSGVSGALAELGSP